MIDKKEQFVLSLQGWKYEGIFDDWYCDHWNDYVGTINNNRSIYLLSHREIQTRDCNQERTILFLKNNTYYVLGNNIND